MEKEIISVLIPTYNAQRHIQVLLTKLLQQELQSNQELEIIIVDSSSTDNTISIIEAEYPSVKYRVIKNNEFDHGGTRNLLANISIGDYLLFMTQDAVPYDNFLIKKLRQSFQEENVVAAYARQVPKEDANRLEVFARNFNYPPHSIIKSKETIQRLGIKTFFNSNVCSMYDKKTFYKFDMFPEKLILNEDMVYASKAILNGSKIYYNSDAKVYHSHNYNFQQQFRRYFDIGMAFEETSYLLKYASNEKEGIRMVVKQLKFLIKGKNFNYVPVALIETLCKFLGYKIGQKHKKMPIHIKKKFSAYMK
ncbi:glycosyltransferase family 2 protein [Priestia aryabhattai]